jgi:UDP-N-acetylmuramate: L-alanyl-gamma-D-glutamyl-meso-diaminopimelate ligase
MSRMNVHFIAIGGAVMHNLAIALLKKGYSVTGSDDEIFEPSRSKLASYGLLPPTDGWNINRITPELDSVIIGMHAKADNPELIKAKEMGLKIMSFPEYIYNQTNNKKRIVVAGSHGKTTTTAMIMHVLKYSGRKFDYMVGSSIEGYETMVSLSDDSEIAVLEGDEYLTSPIDRRPKFHLYKPDIAIINGIAWDHMNVFATYENYFEQFRIFADTITQGGTLVFFEGDPEARKIALLCRNDIKKIPFKTHGYFQNKKGFFAASHNRVIQMEIFGEHNMQNLAAARETCYATGISEDDFYSAIQSFQGTSKRLQKINENNNGIVYLDFAHAPSKVKATVEAVAERYPGRAIIACLELHTFSSLNAAFLPHYRGSLDKASLAFIYYNPHTIALKKLPPLKVEKVKEAFGDDKIKVFSNSGDLFSIMKEMRPHNPVFLLMSSGDFDGMDFYSLSEELLSNK